MSFAAVLLRDVRREWRSKEAALGAFVLLALFVVLDIFAFADLSGQSATAAAVLWAPMLFGAAAVCGRSLAGDVDRSTMDLLRSAPVPLGWLGLSRTAVHAILLAALAVVGAYVAGGLFGFAIPPLLTLVLLLAACGTATVATLAGGLSAQARTREALTPILLVPAIAPLVQAGVQATTTLLAGTGASVRAPLLALAGYDLIALGAAWLLWPIVLEGD